MAGKSVALFHYSLTGTTEYLAKLIAEQFEAVGFQKPIVHSLLDALHDNNYKAEGAAAQNIASVAANAQVLGFGSLSWNGQEAPGVRDLISQLPDSCIQGKPCFIFVCGASMAGRSFKRLEREIQMKGGWIVGRVLCVVGVSNFVLFTWRKLRISSSGFEAAKKQANELALKISTWTPPSSTPPKPTEPRDNAELGPQTNSLPPIKVDKKLCIKCGLCVRNCPVKCIDMEDGFPVSDHNRCIGCCRCLNQCPKQALAPEGISGTSWAHYGHFDPSRIDPTVPIRMREVIPSVFVAMLRLYPRRTMAVLVALFSIFCGLGWLLVRRFF